MSYLNKIVPNGAVTVSDDSKKSASANASAPKEKITDKQKSVFQQALSMPKVLNKEFANYESGKDYNRTFEFHRDNSSVYYTAKAANGNYYEVDYLADYPHLRNAKIVNDDGSIMSIDIVPDGNIIREINKSYLVDASSDGVYDYRYDVKYDENMNIHSAEEDADNDGFIEKRYSYIRDDDGNIVKTDITSYNGETRKHEYDMTIEALGQDNSYHKNQKTTTHFFDKKGKSDYTITEIYDEMGRIREYAYDDHHDNFWTDLFGTSKDYTEIYSYDTDVVVTYNAKGKVVDVEYKDR